MSSNYCIFSRNDEITEKLTEPQAVKEANNSYREDMDSLTDFMNTCLFLNQGPEVKCTSRDIYSVYLKWCSVNGERSYSQRSLVLKIQEKGYTKYRSNGTTCFTRLGIKGEWLVR